MTAAKLQISRWINIATGFSRVEWATGAPTSGKHGGFGLQIGVGCL